MAASKIPLILATLVGTHITCTPPTAPALDREQKSEPVKIGRVAPYLKLSFWGLLLAEAAAIVASNNTQSPASRRILRFLLVERTASRLGNDWLSVVGTLLSFCGGMIRLACYRKMGRHFTFDVSIRDEHKLITAGPYGVVRHPSYTGVLMNVAGVICYYASERSLLRASGVMDTTIGRASAVCILILLLLPPLFIPNRMRLEDGLLKTQFGKDWENWAEKVPYRLIPWIY